MAVATAAATVGVVAIAAPAQAASLTEVGHGFASRQVLGSSLVAVSQPDVSYAHRRVTAHVRLNRSLRNEAKNRFNLTVVLVVAKPNGRHKYLSKSVDATRPSKLSQSVSISLSRSDVHILKRAQDAALTVTQKASPSGSATTRFRSSAVTVRHLGGGRLTQLPGRTARAATDYTDCSGQMINSQADETGCDLFGADLSETRLDTTTFVRANLTGADLSDSNTSDSANYADSQISYPGPLTTPLSMTPACLAAWHTWTPRAGAYPPVCLMA